MGAKGLAILGLLMVTATSPLHAADAISTAGKSDPITDGISTIEKLARDRALQRHAPPAPPASPPAAVDKPAAVPAPLPPVASMPLPPSLPGATNEPVVEAVRGAAGGALKATLRFPDGTRTTVSVGSTVGSGKVIAILREGVTVDESGRRRVIRFGAVRGPASAMPTLASQFPMMPQIPMTPAGPALPRP